MKKYHFNKLGNFCVKFNGLGRKIWKLCVTNTTFHKFGMFERDSSAKGKGRKVYSIKLNQEDEKRTKMILFHSNQAQFITLTKPFHSKPTLKVINE